jgi:hypothetical protein
MANKTTESYGKNANRAQFQETVAARSGHLRCSLQVKPR